MSPLRGEVYCAVRVVPPGEVRVKVCLRCPPGVSSTLSCSGAARVSRGKLHRCRGFARDVVVIGETAVGAGTWAALGAAAANNCGVFHLTGIVCGLQLACWRGAQRQTDTYQKKSVV